MVFNKTLGDSEVSQLYSFGRNGLYRSYLDSLKIADWWSFDDGTARDVLSTVVRDQPPVPSVTYPGVPGDGLRRPSASSKLRRVTSG